MKIRATCIECRYRRPASGMNPSETVCHYLLDTGLPRNCPADHCNRWQPSLGRALVDSLARQGVCP